LHENIKEAIKAVRLVHRLGSVVSLTARVRVGIELVTLLITQHSTSTNRYEGVSLWSNGGVIEKASAIDSCNVIVTSPQEGAW